MSADAVSYPRLLHPVVDATDVRAAAEFYRQLLGLDYRPGDAPPADDAADEAEWLVLRDGAGANVLAFQRVDRQERTTWPSPDVPMQLHLDFTVSSLTDLERHRRRAESLGAHLLVDDSADPDEALYVLADLDGHPFCLFVALH
jgi:catechol 2,3-dioxygenase-like lactoylglutathione lyase family enzyme